MDLSRFFSFFTNSWNHSEQKSSNLPLPTSSRDPYLEKLCASHSSGEEVESSGNPERASNGHLEMNLDNYQSKAMETAIYPEKIGLQYTILGLTGEAGEVANLYKKVLRDHNGNISTETLNKLLDELGDCLWYLAMISAELQTNLSTVAQRNISKLAARKINNTLHGSGDNR